MQDLELQSPYNICGVFDTAGLLEGLIIYLSEIVLSVQRRYEDQGELVIKNAGPQIQEVFEITGFSDFLKIE